MVFDETRLAVKRLNQAEATRAVLLNMAVSAVLSKDAGELFDKRVTELTKE